MEDTNLTEVLSESDPSAVLNEFLTEIANALREKKETTEPILASEFANEIRGLSSGLSFADFLTTRENDLQRVFVKGTQEFVQAGINLIDWSNLNENYDSVQLKYLCQGNQDLVSITIDDHDLIDKPIYAANILGNCWNLQHVNLLLNGLVGFYSLFRGCYALVSVVLKHYTSAGRDPTESWGYGAYMFGECHSLKRVVFQSIDPAMYEITNKTFSSCYHLTGTQNDDYNPDGLRDGRIYVPDNMVDTLKQAENWSDYADLIYPLSEYVPEEE